MRRSLYLFMSLMIVAASGNAVFATEPPKEPILRLETGMHTVVIKRIATDEANRFLVTTSNDKTIRVWELAGGRLLRVIRPPIAEGNEGKLYSLAMSPDGSTIACAGWTGENWGDAWYIYLFDRESGRLKARIPNLTATIMHMAFSKDGRYLVACLWGKYGIRIFRMSDLAMVAQDPDYTSDSYGADFSRNGRLVTASWDGYVRLYGPDFRLISKIRSPGGARPYQVSFSPDGSKIAVGFDDTSRVDVLSGHDLSYLFSPDSQGITRTLIAVNWSSDGQSIYAGGTHYQGPNRLIVKWSDGGRGRPVFLPGSYNTILQILPLRRGGIVYAAYDPVFGAYDGADRRFLYRRADIADYRDNRDGFLVSYDGTAVQFGYEQWGKSPTRFSIVDRSLSPNPPADGSLTPPIMQAPGLKVTGWQYTTNPMLNGAPLKLEPYERALSLAISPDHETVLVGADWSLRLFDRNGNQLWRKAIPDAAWGVNISGNGRVAVAAFGDGTIRWYRMTDGQELLVFFPHRDKRRWALWSPSGYYDASPGSDEFIGWHVNNGRDSTADFFPASRFRGTYYRPDVLARIPQTLDGAEALRQANEESGRSTQQVVTEKILPPVVTILSPGDGATVTTTEITVRFSVRAPSGEPVTGVKALVDGRPVSTERGVKIAGKDGGDARELRMTIPQKDVEVSIIAENRYAASEPSTIRLRWSGKKRDDPFIIKPKLYVLAIGISQYRDRDLVLQFAAKDARDFASAMSRQKGGLYRDVETKVITDGTATKDEILDGLDWLRQATTSKDVAMVFMAGHGVNDQAGIYYFLPSNANTDKLMRTAVAFSDIKNTVSTLAGKTVLFVDTCHSGNVMGSRRGVADVNALVNELSSAENGAVVFASSTGRQYSLENQAWGNGAFTKALVEGLSGQADYHGSGKITINMLDLYVSERVKVLTGGKQTPTTTKPQTISDFPVAVKQ